jgi:two-component system catabolic regulation response regulator CreB
MASTRALRILVVEDDALVGRALRRALTERGHRVELAITCGEARGATGPFDCAVLDIDLPDGSGLDLARELLGTVSPAVVFFSGSDDPQVRLDASDLGTFVPKSAGVEQLEEIVKESVEEAAEELAAGAEDTPVPQGEPGLPRTRTGPRKKRF